MNSYTLVLICIVSCVGLKFWCSYKVLDGRMDEKKKKNSTILICSSKKNLEVIFINDNEHLNG